MIRKRRIRSAVAAAAVLALSACGSGAEPDATSPEEEVQNAAGVQPGYDGTTVKPGAPFRMSYRIIGTPIVGSPVTVELRVETLARGRQIAVDYRINDSATMLLHEAQPARVLIEPADNENFVIQRVTVVPQRQGRMYLNVAASIDTDDGSQSSIMAVPIQVGEGGRVLEEQGEVVVDEDGEAIRVLPGD